MCVTLANVTILLQPRRVTNDSATQLSLFPDEAGRPDHGLADPEADGLAPMRGILASVSLGLLLWATALSLVWFALR